RLQARIELVADQAASRPLSPFARNTKRSEGEPGGIEWIDRVEVDTALVGTNGLEPQRLAQVSLSNGLESEFLGGGVISAPQIHTTPAMGKSDATDHIRRPVVSVIDLFKRNRSREAMAAVEGVADEVGAIGAAAVELA